MEDVRQSDLMEELGIVPIDRKALRDELLSPADWEKRGRTIWIKHTGIVKLRVWKEEPGLVAKNSRFRVCGLPPNPRFVLINVDGRGCRCAIPARLKKFMTKGKEITVQVVTDVSGTSYRHEDLA